MYDQLQRLVHAYQHHGPIFRQQFGGQQMIVLAGPTANVFLANAGDRFFSSRPFFTPFVNELGVSDFIVAMDGAPHRNMRSIMKPVFSRESIARAVPQIVGTMERRVREWHTGKRVQMVQAFRRTIMEQLSLLMMNRDSSADFEVVSEFFDTLVGCTISGSRPPTALRSFSFFIAKQRVFGIMREIIAERHASGPRDVPDFIDQLIAGKTDEGEALHDDVLLAASMVPFFAGIDTVANTCSFMLYSLLKHPALLAHVQAEVDEVLESGPLTFEALKQMQLLHGTAMETLRMYPVAPAAMRYVTESFEFEGEVVESGQMVMIATPVAHFLPELWPEPETFDIERYRAPRNEHRQPGAFAPFFKGPHTCLGAALGEAQILITVATLLHRSRLMLDPPTYELQCTIDPILTPLGGYYVVPQQLPWQTTVPQDA